MNSLLRLGLAIFCVFIAFVAPARAEQFNLQDELAYRVEFGNEEDVALLLKRGGDPNGINELGWPLVSIASRRVDGMSVKIVRILTEAGADINQGGPSRQYPIIIAARNGDTALARFLLERNVDTAVRDRNGVEPVNIAKYYGHDRVFDLLEAQALARAEEKERERSPEHRVELLRELITKACGIQYMTYYFKAGAKPDEYSKEEREEILGTLQLSMNKAAGDLFAIFKTSQQELMSMREFGAKNIFQELEDMISPRNRRRLGVGKESDRLERCGKIADKWMEQAAEAEKKKQKKNKYRP